MTVYSGPVFDMAVNQFGVIADHLSIPIDEREEAVLEALFQIALDS
jgi:glutamate dehydrogenase (NAD(P)+)